jgi:hypothetical protein
MQWLQIACGIVFVFVISSGIVADAGWQVRRNIGNGACSLQPADASPIGGSLLITKPTKREACEAAKSLKTDDAADSTRCFDYTPNTMALCHAEGVDLP